jgi:cell shape-determining protein MreC
MRSPLGNRGQSRESILPLVILFCVLFLIIGTPLRTPIRALVVGISTPFWKASTAGKVFFSELIPSVFSGPTLLRENQQLKAEIATLRAEYWRSEVIKNERDILRGMLGRSTTTERDLLAYVLAAPNFAPYDTLVLDVGEDTGIFSGARVKTDGGFVIGTITEVFGTRSIAQLYSSPGLIRDVVVGSARVPAVAHGVGGGNYRVELPKNTDTSVGDEVSVLGSVEEFLGVVEEIVVDEKTGITVLFLRLPINMTELRSVIVDLSHSYTYVE